MEAIGEKFRRITKRPLNPDGISEVIENYGHTIYEVAVLAGVHPNTLYLYLQKKRKIKPITLKKIEGALLRILGKA